MKDEICSYYGGSTIFKGEGSQKNNIYEEFPKKGLRQFAEGLAKNKEEGVDTSMHTMT